MVFLCLSVLDLGSKYAIDVRHQTGFRETDVRQKHRLMPPPIRGGGIITLPVQTRVSVIFLKLLCYIFFGKKTRPKKNTMNTNHYVKELSKVW